MDESNPPKASATPLYVLVTYISSTDLAQEAINGLKRLGIKSLEEIAGYSSESLSSVMSREAHSALGPYLNKEEIDLPVNNSSPKVNPEKPKTLSGQNFLVLNLIERIEDGAYRSKLEYITRAAGVRTVADFVKIDPDYVKRNGVDDEDIEMLEGILQNVYNLDWEKAVHTIGVSKPEITKQAEKMIEESSTRLTLAALAKKTTAPPESIFEHMPSNYPLAKSYGTKSRRRN